MDHGIVAGDDLLALDIKYGFHHVELVADTVHVGDDEVEAGPQCCPVTAEAFHGPLISLGYDLDAGNDRDDSQCEDDQCKC